MTEHYSIISARRAGNVPMMEGLLAGLDPTWLVPEGEGADYRYAGGQHVVEAAGYIEQRNAALDMAFAQGRVSVQLDDDLHPWKKTSRYGMALTDGKTKSEVSVADAVGVIRQAMQNTGAKLGGIAPTTNAYFYRHPVSTAHFVSACFAVVEPCDLRFDATLQLKADYDYTLQHLREFAVVARCDGVLGNFHRYSNRGGAVSYRTPELMEEMCKVLIERWPGSLRPNPRRPGELLMRWKR